MTRFIAILSGKGGAGKTTVAIHLAAALRKSGKDVSILDANLSAPDLGIYFGIADFKTDLSHVIKGEKEIKEAIYMHPSGFKIIPSSINNSQLKYHAPDFREIFRKLNGLSEIVLIDCPAGLGDEVKEIIENSDEVLVVANPDMLSATNALRTIKASEENDKTVLGVVLNRIKNSSYEIDSKSMENFLGMPVIAEISEDEMITKARAERKPLIFDSPNDSFSRFSSLAEKIAGEDYPKRGIQDGKKNY